MSAAGDTRWGGSSAATRIKQEHFTSVLRHQLKAGMAAMQSARRRWPWWGIWDRYLYLDFNGGCGQLGDPEDPDHPLAGLDGSPVIAVREALEAACPFFGVIFEKDPRNLARLRARLIDEVMGFSLDQGPHDARLCLGCPGCSRLLAEERLNRMVRLVEGDHNVTFWSVLKWLIQKRKRVYGLAYADPYGKDGLPVGPLEALSHEPLLKRIDILVNVAAVPYKRARGAGLAEIAAGRQTRMVEHAESYLLDDLDRIEKEFRYLREPVGKQQWTMFFGTNWQSNTPKKSLGFAGLMTTRGQEIVTTLNLRSVERTNGAT